METAHEENLESDFCVADATSIADTTIRQYAC